MNYEIDKIRRACLELMGWRRETSQNFLDRKTDVIWTHTDGRERYERVPYPDPLPDPTRSLDDALPLMEKYGIGVMMIVPAERSMSPFWNAWTSFTNSYGEQSAKDGFAALAVCLCALRCAGRDLKEFEKGDHERD